MIFGPRTRIQGDRGLRNEERELYFREEAGEAVAGAAAAVALLVDHLGPAGAQQLARGIARVCF